jgi:hypothetical protein
MALAAATFYLAKPSCFCFTPKIPFPSNSRVLSSRCSRFGTLKPKAGLSQFLNIVETTSSYIQLPLQLELQEPSNALSLPTWAVHVSSVVEWIIAMALVWQYGEKSGYEAWKGLSWGMVSFYFFNCFKRFLFSCYNYYEIDEMSYFVSVK